MKKRMKYLYSFLLISLLLCGMTGCGTPESERFRKTPATFWDGIWHGIFFLEYVAKFTLTKKSLENLQDDGISEDVLKELKILENQTFVVKNNFLNSVKQQIGQNSLNSYKDLILKHARGNIPVPTQVTPKYDSGVTFGKNWILSWLYLGLFLGGLAFLIAVAVVISGDEAGCVGCLGVLLLVGLPLASCIIGILIYSLIYTLVCLKTGIIWVLDSIVMFAKWLIRHLSS